MKIDLSNSLAAEMDRVLNSEENKQLFSTSSMIEKLAFKKVSEEDAETEIEKELESQFSKTASCKNCECKNTKHDKCHCDCHDSNEADDKIETFPDPSNKGVNSPYVPGTQPPVKDTKDTKKASPVRDAFHSLLKISEVLDNAGFEKEAAAAILLADQIIVEAKAKKSEKSKSKKSKEDKAKSKTKMDVKERMQKMRDAQKGKKDDKKSKSKKSEAQVQPPPQHMQPRTTPKREADVILGALNTDVRACIQALEVMPTDQMGVRSVLVRFQPGKENAMAAVKSTVTMLSQQNQLPGKTYTFTRV